MSLLWGWISKYLWGAVAIAGAALLLWGLWERHSAGVWEAKAGEIQNAWTLDRAQATAAALKQTENYRALEAQMQSVQEQAKHDYDAAQTRNDAALAAARAGADKLRGQLAAYASNAGSATPDTASSASDRAGKLGELLAAALQLDAEHAADAESNADAVRALLAAWPHEDVAISLPKMKLGQ